MLIRKLSPELQKKAIQVLNEIPDRIQDDLNHLRNWMEKQPHIKFRKDDQWLLTFLRGCKFSLEKTKEKLREFYVLRHGLPEIFCNRDPFQPEIQEVLKLGVLLPLPSAENECGPRINLMRFKDPINISHDTVMKVQTMIVDILLVEDDTFMIAGSDLFVDFTNFSMKHLTVDFNMLQKTITCLQCGYPVRPQGSHFYNVPSFAEMLINFCKPFIRSKLRDRLYFYNETNIGNMYKTIPLHVLPKEYGGEGASVEYLTEYWKKKVESYRDWFLDDTQYGTTSDYYQSDTKHSLETHGIQGSFRKLELD